MPRDEHLMSPLTRLQVEERDEALREAKTLLHGLLGDAVRIVPEYRDDRLLTLFVIPKEAREHVASWAIGMTYYRKQESLPEMWVRCTDHAGDFWYDAHPMSAKLAALIVAEDIDGLPHLPADHPVRRIVEQARALSDIRQGLRDPCEAFHSLNGWARLAEMHDSLSDVREWVDECQRAQGRQMRTYRVTLPKRSGT